MSRFDDENNFYTKQNYVATAAFTEIIYDIDLCKDYLGIEYDFKEDNNLIWVLMDASASYIRNYTCMLDSDLDKHHEATLVFLMLLSEFYNNRTISMSTGDAGIFNKMLNKMMISLKTDWL